MSRLKTHPKDNKEYQRGLREAYLNEKLFVLPSDTLPGLSFNPNSEKAFHLLYEVKGRQPSKSCLALVSSLEMALDYYDTLPPYWKTALSKLWPNPLTVIYKAANNAPRYLVSESQEIALRFPRLDDEKKWVYDFITSLNCPLPSTSMNKSGDPSISNWEDAINFAEDNKIFIGEKEASYNFSNDSSTLIRIFSNNEMEVVRQGVLEESEIRKVLSEL